MDGATRWGDEVRVVVVRRGPGGDEVRVVVVLRGDEESGAEETRTTGRRRRERRGGRRGVGAETRTTGRRRGGGAAASGEERGRGSRARAREREGIGLGRGGNMDGGGTILMAHHPSVRHKYIHTNGAPHPGAPLVFFFLLEPTGYLPPDLIHTKFPLLARLVSSQFSHQEVLGSIPRLHNFFMHLKCCLIFICV